MLDAARELLLERGAGGATVEAIAATSGAPVGSIYHRFGSRDELLGRLWLRAVARSQASFLAAIEHEEDPREAVLAAALSIVDFCDAEPADARLLVSFRREDLMGTASPALAAELGEVNAPVERAIADLARRLYGRAGRSAVGRTALAVFDLPYGATRRYLVGGERPPRGLRDDVQRAVAALLP
jgi:AcrR family transcriptional regulator